MAEDTLSSEFYWNNIFIKVEDKLFCVPVCEFVKSSEVFADLFHLPSGPASRSEGQDREHPIVLPEGYKKDEFTSLLRVMYPTAGSMISDDKFELHLEKEEWVSVLKLSTIWDMKKIRQHAIHRLSSDVTLSPVEKLLLARAHRVSKWLTEAITSLASINAMPTLEDLAPLGWETAAQILWMTINSQSNTSSTLSFKRNKIKCGSCSSSSSLIDSDITCYNCERRISVDDELTSPDHGSPTSGTTGRMVSLNAINCGHCGRRAFSYRNFSCNSCFSGGDNVRIAPKKSLKAIIEEKFGEEIKDYKFSETVA